MFIFTIFVLSLVTTNVFSLLHDDDDVYMDNGKKACVDPKHLDKLLEDEDYKEFGEMLGIDDVDLVTPQEEEDRSSRNPMYHKELFQMDILRRKWMNTSNTEERQASNFDRYPNMRWKNGIVPYAIASTYTPSQRKTIEDAISNWNKRVKCLKFKPRKAEKDYVYYFNGKGCYSDMGRTGCQQGISIEVQGCLWQGTVDHEMEHAVGVTHEMNRLDRDDYIEVLWDNILPDWKFNFDKNDPKKTKDILEYDYYSLMHYAIASPNNEEEPAFEILKDDIDESKVGTADDFTEMDIKKLNVMYC